MDKDFQPYLEWIKGQQKGMVSLLEDWAAINSGSENLSGLKRMLKALKRAFDVLGVEGTSAPLLPRKKMGVDGEMIEVPVGEALLMSQRPEAPIKVLLVGHMDTVFGADSPFQKVKHLKGGKLRGPGVADMKGGLVVMLKALEALERSPYAPSIGWQVLIIPDEEVGSQSSQHLLLEGAYRTMVGLVFEPAFSDGALAEARGGSANCVLVAKGKGAHVGRDFTSGRNAITALARTLLDIESLSDEERGIAVNVGKVEGGGPVNIVPALATAHINLRMRNSEDLALLKETLAELVDLGNQQEGIILTLQELSERPPKTVDEKTEDLFALMQSCAKEIGFSLEWKPTGGVCDGNTLANAGLPTLDTLGVVGGNLHTEEEYMLIDSLTERASMVALFLMKFAKEMHP